MDVSLELMVQPFPYAFSYIGLLMIDVGLRGCFGPMSCKFDHYRCSVMYIRDLVKRYDWLIGVAAGDNEDFSAGAWPVGPANSESYSCCSVNCTAKWAWFVIADDLDKTRMALIAVGILLVLGAVFLKTCLRLIYDFPNLSVQFLIRFCCQFWNELCCMMMLIPLVVMADYVDKYRHLAQNINDGQLVTVAKEDSARHIDKAVLMTVVLRDLFTNWSGLATLCAIITALSNVIYSVSYVLTHFRLPQNAANFFYCVSIYTPAETFHVAMIILSWRFFINVNQFNVEQLCAMVVVKVISYQVIRRLLSDVQRNFLSPSNATTIRSRLMGAFGLACVALMYAVVTRYAKTLFLFDHVSPLTNINAVKLWLTFPMCTVVGAIWGLFAQAMLEIVNECFCRCVLNCQPANARLPASVISKLVNLVVSWFEFGKLAAEYRKQPVPTTILSVLYLSLVCEAIFCIVSAGLRRCCEAPHPAPVAVVANAAGGNGPVQAAVVVPAAAETVPVIAAEVETDQAVNEDQPAEPTAPGVVDGSPSTCPICLSAMIIASSCHTTACGHTFHKQCLSSWLEIQPTCFNCGRSVNSIAAT